MASQFVPLFSQPNYLLITSLLNAFNTGDQRKQKWIGVVVNGGEVFNYPYKYKLITTSVDAAKMKDQVIFHLVAILCLTG